MSASLRSLAATAALVVAVTLSGCSQDGDPADRLADPGVSATAPQTADSSEPATTTTTAPDGAGLDGPVTTGADGVPEAGRSIREVEGCAGLAESDFTDLGGADLRVEQMDDVTARLVGEADGGNGCWFHLTRGETEADLFTLVHRDGQAYFEGATGSGDLGTPIDGLGDAAVALSSGDRATVITLRGPLVVEAEVSNTAVLDDTLLIAVAGLALERA